LTSMKGKVLRPKNAKNIYHFSYCIHLALQRFES